MNENNGKKQDALLSQNKLHVCLEEANILPEWGGGGRLKPPPYLYASLVFLTMVGSLFTNMVGSLFTKTLDKSKEC